MPETGSGTEQDWEAHFERERVALPRRRGAAARGDEDADARQRQLTRLGNAAGGAGLALLMQARPDEAAEWFHRAAARYRESFADAPPDSWGRPIGAIKALVLAGDWPARRGGGTLGARGRGRRSAERRSAATPRRSRCSSSGDDEQAREHADAIRTRDDFPVTTSATRSPTSPRRTSSATPRRSRPCSSRSRPARSTWRTCRSPTRCSSCRRSPRRRGLEAELSSPLLP